MEEKEYLDNYEQRLTAELLRVCTQQGKLAGQLLPSPDLDDKWEELHRSTYHLHQVDRYHASSAAQPQLSVHRLSLWQTLCIEGLIC